MISNSLVDILSHAVFLWRIDIMTKKNICLITQQSKQASRVLTREGEGWGHFTYKWDDIPTC